jgi:hypothetical protein
MIDYLVLKICRKNWKTKNDNVQALDIPNSSPFSNKLNYRSAINPVSWIIIIILLLNPV